MVSYENFYTGNYSSLDPEYGELFTGYRVTAGQLGATTSIQTANQLKEVTNLLNQGMTNVEVSTIQPEVFEMIPDQHLKEINRLSKLTGTETSLHAPLVDPAGFTQQGWSEPNREVAEKQFKDVMERSHELNPDGNIPVTIHATAQAPGTEFIPFDAVKGLTEEEKERWKDYGGVPQRMIAVNQETGEFIPLIREERFYPRNLKREGKDWKGKIYRPEEELEIANASYWDQRLSQLVFYKERGDELLQKYYPLIAGQKEFTAPEQKIAAENVNNAMIYFRNSYMNIDSLFNQAYKFANETGKRELRNASEKFKEQFAKAHEKTPEGTRLNPSLFSQAIQGLIYSMQNITEKYTPPIYQQIEKFAKEKATETFSNIALNSYKKFGENSPIVSIENPPYGGAIANAQDLKDLVEMARQRFVEKAKKQGYSEGQARNVAEKLIGVTWDTSHISMMRKKGFGKEQLIEEAKKIAPYVKHVHLNDNFGSTHTDLPPGMGSVPMKEVLQELEKAGFKGKKIFEGGAFFQHFQTSPHPYVLEALGSPLYGMTVGPYWNQMVASQGGYFAGYGTMLPEQHFSMYGAGFSGLPQELGGQISGRQSRMSGAPNA